MKIVSGFCRHLVTVSDSSNDKSGRSLSRFLPVSIKVGKHRDLCGIGKMVFQLYTPEWRGLAEKVHDPLIRDLHKDKVCQPLATEVRRGMSVAGVLLGQGTIARLQPQRILN